MIALPVAAAIVDKPTVAGINWRCSAACATISPRKVMTCALRAMAKQACEWLLTWIPI